jgi:hypothetical protein
MRLVSSTGVLGVAVARGRTRERATRAAQIRRRRKNVRLRLRTVSPQVLQISTPAVVPRVHGGGEVFDIVDGQPFGPLGLEGMPLAEPGDVGHVGGQRLMCG